MQSTMTIDEAIAMTQAKGGESYSDKGHRNPIRKDTNEVLTALTIAADPRVVVELGTAYGTSTLCIAKGLTQPYGFIRTFELSPEVAEESQALFDSLDVNARVVAGPFDPKDLPTVTIDMLFLDHEKGKYLEHFQVIEPFMRANALVIADNVNDRRSECGDFVDYMLATYRTTIIHNECGLLVARLMH